MNLRYYLMCVLCLIIILPLALLAGGYFIYNPQGVTPLIAEDITRVAASDLLVIIGIYAEESLVNTWQLGSFNWNGREG